MEIKQPCSEEECLAHGQMNERVTQVENRLDCVDIKQEDIRKPENGALAQMNKTMTFMATKDDLKDHKRSMLSWIGVMVGIVLIIVLGSYRYTNSVETSLIKIIDKVDKQKERLDVEVVTKKDMDQMRCDVKEYMKEVKDEIKRLHGGR